MQNTEHRTATSSAFFFSIFFHLWQPLFSLSNREVAIWDQTPSRLERGASLFSAMGHINGLEMQSQEFSCRHGECTCQRVANSVFHNVYAFADFLLSD